MRTTYTVTGSSTTRPTGLPAGLTVRSKIEPFTAEIGAFSDGDSSRVKVEEQAAGILSPARTRLTVTGLGMREAVVTMSTEQVRKLRDALSARLIEVGPVYPRF